MYHQVLHLFVIILSTKPPVFTIHATFNWCKLNIRVPFDIGWKKDLVLKPRQFANVWLHFIQHVNG